MRAHMRRAEESIVDVESRLVFPHEALSVPVMRKVLGDTLRRFGADEEGVSDLLLAVTEACTNVLNQPIDHKVHGHGVARVFPSTETRLNQCEAPCMNMTR